MKKIFLHNFSKIFLLTICTMFFFTIGVFAYSDSIRLQYLMNFSSDYTFTISLSTDGITYNNIYDNSNNNTIPANNFTIKPEKNDIINIASNYSDLSQVVYLKITNYTESKTLRASISSLYIYGTSADVAGISSQTATYNNSSSAIEIDLGTGIEATDIIIIGLTITE